MSISNILLVRSIYSNREVLINSSEENSARKKSLTYTILTITVMFLILTLADNILNAFFLPIILVEDYGYNLLFFADSLAFTYHGLQFIILLVTNKKFKSEFNLMMKCSNKVENLSTNMGAMSANIATHKNITRLDID